MSANFSPEFEGYSSVEPFRFWCQKVLPLTYDDSLSYYELLCKVVNYVNHLIEDVSDAEDNIAALHNAYDELEGYVNNYFDNLDLQTEIDNKLDKMAINGTLTALISPLIPNAVSSWLSNNVDPVGSAVVVDSTLSVTGAAADAKVTGDSIKAVLETSVLLDNTDTDLWKAGNFSAVSNNQSSFSSSTTRITSTPSIEATSDQRLRVTCPSGYKYRMIFLVSRNVTPTAGYVYNVSMGDYDDGSNWHTDNRIIQMPSGATSFCVCVAATDDSSIGPSNPPALVVENMGMNSVIKEEVLDAFISETGKFKELITPVTWYQGYVNPNGNVVNSSNTRCCFNSNKYIDTSRGKQYVFIDAPNTIQSRITFWSSSSMSSEGLIVTGSNAYWSIGKLCYEVPEDAVFYRVSVAYVSGANIAPADLTTLDIYEVYGGYIGKLDFLKGMKLSILGDSISTFSNSAATDADGHSISDGTYTYAGNHCRYPNDTVKSVVDTYWYKLISALGLELDANDSWAGSRITWDGTTESGDIGADKYIASPTRIGHLNGNGTPDIILVQAGTNDIGANVTIGEFDYTNPSGYDATTIAALPVDTFADAVRTLLIRLQYAYKNSKIVFMLPSYTTSYYDAEKNDKYCEVIKEACDYFGVEWIDVRTCGITVFNTSTYLYDGIHPNVAGFEKIFRALLDKLK